MINYRRDRLKRRSLLAAFAAAAWPLAAQSQQPGRQYRLAYLGLSRPPEDALFSELARAGFVEGKNLVLDVAPTTLEGLQARAAAIVAANPDVIFAGGDAPARVARAATRTIPIVTISDNLQSNGLLASFARPEGNLTGVNIFANELNGKRQEVLSELIPGLKRMALLVDPSSTTPEQVDVLVKAAVAAGIECKAHRVTNADGIAAAIEAARAGGAQALNVLASPLFHSRHAQAIALIAAARLPAVYQWPQYVEEGALIGYGPRLATVYRKLIARQLIRILKGAKPADVPAEQPTDFELSINLKTAKALGLTIPPSILARADEVIE